jgi:hypothetical protein
MITDDFKREVGLNRPRLALAMLVPVIDGLLEKIADLEAKVDALTPAKKAAPAAKKEVKEPVVEKKAPAKKTVAKKTTPKKKAPTDD